jgi:hypothetical protein
MSGDQEIKWGPLPKPKTLRELLCPAPLRNSMKQFYPEVVHTSNHDDSSSSMLLFVKKQKGSMANLFISR